MRFKQIFLTAILSMLVLTALSGCAKRTIIEGEGTVGVTTQLIKGAHVAFPDANKKPVDTVVDLPVGTLVKTPKPKAPPAKPDPAVDAAGTAKSLN